MKIVLREDESGVSEVIGTILILAMTVVLFSTIIIWVSSIPTPVAQTRLDVQGSLTPKFVSGNEQGDWVNLTHNGGEALQPGTTIIYIVDQKGSAVPTTSTLRLHLLQSGATPNGLLDGSDSAWNVGERWTYFNASYRVSDKITVTIVDTSRSTVLWTSTLAPPAGTRPPIFLNVWASLLPGTTSLAAQPVRTGTQFYLFAQVTDPDGDLNPNSVYASFTICYQSSTGCGSQITFPMNDKGQNQDSAPSDGIFTLYTGYYLPSPTLSWDGSLILLNATDMKSHTTQTRFTLHVILGSSSTGGPFGNGTSGRPPNLLWNGNQGYNIFTAAQWDTLGYNAVPTRTFTTSDTVVVVVGSLSLESVSGVDTFNLWDPYSGNPQQAVVYGTNKAVGQRSYPSNTSAFSFFQFTNGYYIYTYRFKLTDPATGATVFYTFGTAAHPPYYFFAQYPLSMFLQSGTGNKFTASDSVTIKSSAGTFQQFPMMTTYKDPGFSQPEISFKSTSVMYVKIQMLSADAVVSNVNMGNVIIQDYNGGTQLWRAPLLGYQANMPICPVSGSCTAGGSAISSSTPQNVYFFAVNLSRVNQDPWVPGTQNYAFAISSIKDSDETYGIVSAQIAVTAPLYKMDVVVGTQDATTNSWGTNNYVYYFQNYNGFDWWKSQRVDYCQGGGSSTSGIPGNGVNCPTTKTSGYVRVAFGKFVGDGTLGIAESINTGSGTVVEVYRRGVDANGNIIYLPVFNAPASQQLPEACNAIAAGDVTGVGVQSVICAGTDGRVWYYRNDGNWTFIWVNSVANSKSISSISVGDFNGDGANDIGVGGSSGFAAWYPNLDKRGTFTNPGYSTNQPAVGEYNVYGAPIAGTNYLNTYPSASSPEIVREQQINVPLQNGTTTNPTFDSGTTDWTPQKWNDPTGTSVTFGSSSTGGIGNSGYAYVSAGCVASNTVAGYYWQAFTVSGSPPYTVSVSLSWSVPVYGGTGASSATLYAFVDTGSGAPVLGTQVASQTFTGTSGWVAASVSQSQLTSRITVPGTYYLKIAVRATYATCTGPIQGGFDNVQLSWSSTPGPTSALEHYWYLGVMPTRPGISFYFILRAQGAASTDFDNFTFAYATNVVAPNPPTTGTYTTISIPPSGNVTSILANANVSLPSTIQGQPVWIRVVDTNRVVNSVSLDNLTVYRLYVNTVTSLGSTVGILSGPSASSTVTSTSAGDQNRDGVSDLVVGTSSGTVYLYLGSRNPPGLQTAGTLLYTAPSGVRAVKFGNITTAFGGLNVVVATPSTVYFVNVGARATFGNPISVPGGQGAIQAMGVGDVNGDGADDVVIGTDSGYVLLYANFGGGYAWSYGVLIYNAGSQVYYTLDLGDANNSQYVGR